VALLKGTELAMGLGLRSGIGIGGADGVSVGVSCLLDCFHHLNCFSGKRLGSHHSQMKTFRKFITERLLQLNNLTNYKN
jgi:hypothetical protein